MKNETIRPLSTVRQFSEKHPAFSQGSLRNLIFLADDRQTSKGPIPGNGLDIALLRVGRKLLIDEAKFFEWLDRQNSSEWLGELQELAEKFPDTGVIYDLPSMSNNDRYSLLCYLRRLQMERSNHG